MLINIYSYNICDRVIERVKCKFSNNGHYNWKLPKTLRVLDVDEKSLSYMQILIILA